VTGFRGWLRLHWWVFALLALTLAGTYGRWHDHPKPGSGVLAAAAVLVLLLRVRSPELAWVGNVVAVTLYFALGYDDGPVYLSVFFAAYALTSRLPVRRWWPYTIGVIPIAVASTSQRSSGSLVGNVAWFLWFVAVAFGAAAVGAAMRTRAETKREQARRTATEEQLRMAQDLHDGVGHGLAVIAMQAGVALHVLDREPDKARESLLAIRDTSRESLDALRAELSRLATDPGIVAPRTVRNGLADLPGLVDRVRAGGLDVDLRVSDPPASEGAGAAAYLVVQEALTNVLRHSGATSARVEVTADGGSLVVSVVDDGQGGDVTEGLGLGSMRSRVERLGGTLSIGPTQRGFEVRASIPTGAS